MSGHDIVEDGDHQDAQEHPPHVGANESADAPEGHGRINVVVRCRPLSDAERTGGTHDICRVLDNKLVILLDPGAASNDYLRHDKSREKRYAFDHAFGPEAGTEELFQATAKPLLDAVLRAYNATVLAYGSTGAGKTFTMIGTTASPGVMLRTVGALFDKAAELSYSGSARPSVRCSFIEVYNESLRDLLSADGREGYLDLREDPRRGMCVSGVTETFAESHAEVMELLRMGNQHRTTEPTAMNVTSSRSHAVLQVSVEQQREEQSRDILLGKLSLIDLAGSERASQTENRGARLIEGANINKSLLALGNCINALASGHSFVPYRDSKLTRLLKDSLGGNCRTVMVANISPSHVSYEDTLNTLKYANRAKNIRLSAHQNVVSADTHVSEYQKAITDLQSEVAMLKSKLAQRQPHVAPVFGVIEPELDSSAQEASESWKEEVLRNLEGRTQLQRTLIDIDRGLAQWSIERDKAKAVIDRWDPSVTSPPRCRHVGPSLSTLEDWRDHLAQIEESIRENLEARRSVETRLEQNRVAGRELHAQLPHRVLNEDLRAFLELIQRVQVLEVERLELDHIWEKQRTELEARDEEIASLREQLRFRNEYLRAQRDKLPVEQKNNLPKLVSLLGSTLAEASPLHKRGPIGVMRAWAPAPKEALEESLMLDCKPLREREPLPHSDAREDSLSIMGPPMEAFDWRNMEMPRASQIRGIARLRPVEEGPIVSGSQRPAPKGWQEPPGIPGWEQTGRPPGLHSPDLAPREQPMSHISTDSCGTQRKPSSALGTGMPAPSVLRRTPASQPGRKRGNTCPPLRRRTRDGPVPPGVAPAPPQRQGLIPAAHVGTHEARAGTPPRRIGRGPGLAGAGIEIGVTKAASPSSRQHRGRSRGEHHRQEHPRMHRIGRLLVQPPRPQEAGPRLRPQGTDA